MDAAGANVAHYSHHHAQHQQQQRGGHAQGHAPVALMQKLVRRGHQLELLQAAKSLCDNQDYVDLTIYCEDGVVRAHQMLLATASPFLKVLFQTSPLYGIEEISLILPEVKACVVQALVHFVYTGRVVAEEQHFYSFMKLVYALSINASIEAEATNEKATAFSLPLVPYNAIETPALRKFFSGMGPQALHQLTPLPPAHLPQLPQQQLQPQVSLPQVPSMPALPTQPVPFLPNTPVPPSKVPRLSGASSLPPPIVTSAKMPPTIQLPTQPIPLNVNGMTAIKTEAAVLSSHATVAPGSYIAVDPSTGVSYRVELPNGPVVSATLTSSAGPGEADPLAAIMNETIFDNSKIFYCCVYASLFNYDLPSSHPRGLFDGKRPNNLYNASSGCGHLFCSEHVRQLRVRGLHAQPSDKAGQEARRVGCGRDEGEPDNGCRVGGRPPVRARRRGPQHAVSLRALQ
jgi:hypothetical protein